jgi:hypothetical protein
MKKKYIDDFIVINKEIGTPALLLRISEIIGASCDKSGQSDIILGNGYKISVERNILIDIVNELSERNKK